MKYIFFNPCEHVQVIIEVTDQMQRDYLDCEARSAELGDGKSCCTCSWDGIDIFGTGICELPFVGDCLKDGQAPTDAP
ncbi:MAG: hypothetical protein KH452_06025 [Clostridiales bacterium]|nr:hypothetical protein [Clostridiales bacterium]